MYTCIEIWNIFFTFSMLFIPLVNINLKLNFKTLYYYSYISMFMYINQLTQRSGALVIVYRGFKNTLI